MIIIIIIIIIIGIFYMAPFSFIKMFKKKCSTSASTDKTLDSVAMSTLP